MSKRWIAALALSGLAMPLGSAQAAPTDPWDYAAYDCLNDRWNPLDENGNRIGADPEPGTAAWTARNTSHVECTDQRDSDRGQHPVQDNARSAAMYGEDWYRKPAPLDNVRFHFRQFNVTEIPLVPSAEVYTPCSNAPGDCPGLPAGLERFEPPYPVVVVMHGVIAQDIHHRFNTQTFAENGYMAIGVDGHGAGFLPGVSGPNSQRCANPSDVLDWLATDASGAYGDQADLSRVAVAGHSQGSACALGYQGDPRVHAIIAWDGGDSIAANNCTGSNACQPVMYQRTDGGFNEPTSYPTTYPAGRNRGLVAYQTHKARGMDVFHLSARDTVHIDWNGRGVGFAGNRLFEQFGNYYNVAWLDRHLKGKLVLSGDETPAEEAAERAARQAIAQDAFDRLTAKRFPAGSIDKHNISMGFWDPAKAEASGDPLFGGNVLYAIEGTWTLERFSPFYRSFCSVSVPDYVNGSDGRPGSPTTVRADSGEGGDVRLNGCPVVT
jgi:hypothetical protein